MREREILEALSKVPKDEAVGRWAVVSEAKSWLGTPYHDNGDIKRAGVDCGMLLVRCFVDAGIIPSFDPRPYPIQWAFNQRMERYLELVKKFSVEVPGLPLPGDVVLFKAGHCWAHGGIVTLWPEIIHSNPPGDCREDNCQFNFGLSRRKTRFFSAWERGER